MGKIMLNGKQYGVGGIEKAKDISYDNTSSGMSATNVQGALDEVKSGLSELLTTEWLSQNGRSVAAGSVDDYDFDCTKSGYTLLGVVGTTIASGGGCTTVYIDRPSTTTVRYRIRNNGTSAVTPSKVWVLCLYSKNS